MNRWLVAASLLSALAAAGPTSEPISFGEAIQRAIAHNPDRKVALYEIERVDGLLRQATSTLLPQLAANATYTRLEGNRYVAMNLEANANSLFANITLESPIIDFHAIAERRRARDQVDVTADQADSTKRDVAIATARAYFMAYTTARQLEIATHARDAAKALVDFTRGRHQAGVGNDLDVKRAEAQLATDEADVATAITSKLDAEEALGVIVGGDHPVAAASEPDLGDPHDGPGIASRADVITALRAHEASQWSSDHDWWDWLPSLHLQGSGFFTDPEIAPLPRFGYELNVMLSVPIYDGGYRRGEHEQHHAMLEESAERDVATDRQASSEVRTAHAAVDNTRRARDAAKQAADLAQAVLDLAVTGFKAGTATSLDVTAAQQTQLDAATQALLAEDQFRQAELDLLAATGAFPPR
ncbi:MAG TPA: TolC family protein [Kofleriaceae bacterium]|nr:TolC family protein [Kofleriaceae bacterium]